MYLNKNDCDKNRKQHYLNEMKNPQQPSSRINQLSKQGIKIIVEILKQTPRI